MNTRSSERIPQLIINSHVIKIILMKGEWKKRSAWVVIKRKRSIFQKKKKEKKVCAFDRLYIGFEIEYLSAFGSRSLFLEKSPPVSNRQKFDLLKAYIECDVWRKVFEGRAMLCVLMTPTVPWSNYCGNIIWRFISRLIIEENKYLLFNIVKLVYFLVNLLNLIVLLSWQANVPV